MQGGAACAYAVSDLRVGRAGAPRSVGGVWVVLPRAGGEVIGWIEREQAIR